MASPTPFFAVTKPQNRVTKPRKCVTKPPFLLVFLKFVDKIVVRTTICAGNIPTHKKTHLVNPKIRIRTRALSGKEILLPEKFSCTTDRGIGVGGTFCGSIGLNDLAKDDHGERSIFG